MDLDYDKYEAVGGYIYFFKNGEIIAVYNPFVGLRVKKVPLKVGQYVYSSVR